MKVIDLFQTPKIVKFNALSGVFRLLEYPVPQNH
jgi:hypothetical protein